MFEFINIFGLAPFEFSLVILSAILIGSTKTGVTGAGLITIPIMALIFGGKASTGIVLPMLCFADIFALKYYHQHADLKYVFRPMPWVIIGILVALCVGNNISDKLFKQLIAIIIILCIVFLLWNEINNKQFYFSQNWWFTVVLGIVGGSATMIGNAAGPIMAVYLLSMRLPKNSYIATGVWFFFIINLLKVPLHIFFWETITFQTFLFDITMIPFLAIGAFLGVKLVKVFSEKAYRNFIIIIVIISSLRLLF